MRSNNLPCPLCKDTNPVIEMIYDEGLSGYRAKATCVPCGLEAMSDTFPTYSGALKHLSEIWREIKKDKK